MTHTIVRNQPIKDHLSNYWSILRPWHWVKNILVFVPAFFAIKIHLLFEEPHLILTFISYSIAASFVYIINDWFDVAEDRQHPTKRSRPIAAGIVTKKGTIYLGIFLFTIFLLGIFYTRSWFIIATYVILNIIYTLWLKHYAIVDIVLVSLGFVLRIIAGAIAASVELTHWLIVITFLLAMCLSLAKRRSELLLSTPPTTSIRNALTGYNLKFIDSSLLFLVTCTIIYYIMYCMSPEVAQRMSSPNLYLTIPFVIIGVLRYFQLTIVNHNLHPPLEVLYADRILQSILLLWTFTFYFLIYQ